MSKMGKNPRRPRRLTESDAELHERWFSEGLGALQRQSWRRARSLFRRAEKRAGDQAGRAQARNARAAADAMLGQITRGRYGFRAALRLDRACEVARQNLTLVEREEREAADAEAAERQGNRDSGPPEGPPGGQSTRRRIALLSFLFNWPSTGGGIVHTVELARFLQAAGYEVRLIHPVYAPWGIGQVCGCPFATEPVPFHEADWHRPAVVRRLCEAVRAIAPDHAVLTDCWNFRPWLADGLSDVSDLPVWWRVQAQEGLCPLNNLRLQPAVGGFVQCPHHQLAEADACRRCIELNAHRSGELHRLDRLLSGVGTQEYEAALRRTLRSAAGVLALNPEVAERLRPYCGRVEVVPWGMDPDRFPPPGPPEAGRRRVRILFAGLPAEPIKGFAVLHAACARLWGERRDFELVVTADPAGPLDVFTRTIGWQSQAELPAAYRDCDVLAVPSVAQEGLSRTAVEAMACGRPVIASRIGGMPYAVSDGQTGLLIKPGDVEDWVAGLRRLLDDPPLRRRLGERGRAIFEERFRWPDVIARHYVPLFGAPLLGAPLSSVDHFKEGADPR